MEDSYESSENMDKLPAHILVQRQMQDLIALQKARVFRLEQDVSSQNESIRDNYVAREQYDTDVNRLQDSLRNDYVPRQQYDMAISELEEEKVEHAQTKCRLREMESKLEQASEEIVQLTEQLEAERTAFENACTALKGKNMQEASKTMKVESKYAEITRQCEKQEDILEAKNREIETLERKLRDQELCYKKEIKEIDIEKQQQQYIAKMMEEQERKKNRGGHQGVPKTKLKKR